MKYKTLPEDIIYVLFAIIIIVAIVFTIINQNKFDENCYAQGGTPLHAAYSPPVCLSSNTVIPIEKK